MLLDAAIVLCMVWASLVVIPHFKISQVSQQYHFDYMMPSISKEIIRGEDQNSLFGLLGGGSFLNMSSMAAAACLHVPVTATVTCHLSL